MTTVTASKFKTHKRTSEGRALTVQRRIARALKYQSMTVTATVTLRNGRNK